MIAKVEERFAFELWILGEHMEEFFPCARWITSGLQIRIVLEEAFPGLRNLSTSGLGLAVPNLLAARSQSKS